MGNGLRAVYSEKVIGTTEGSHNIHLCCLIVGLLTYEHK